MLTVLDEANACRPPLSNWTPVRTVDVDGSVFHTCLVTLFIWLLVCELHCVAFNFESQWLNWIYFDWGGFHVVRSCCEVMFGDAAYLTSSHASIIVV